MPLPLGDPRPGPVHLNVPWREPLAPIPAEDDVTASDPLALEGRGERPLQAVARVPMRVPDALLDELAQRIASAPRGLIVAGRQPDPGLAAAVQALSDSAGYPVLAEPTSQLRWGPEGPSALVSTYDLIARERPPELEPELIVRFGELPTSKALRQWLAGAPELRQIVVDPFGDWREPTRRAETTVRGDPGALALGLAQRLKAGAEARRASAADGGAEPWARRWASADERVREAVLAEIGDGRELSEPGVWLELAAALRDGDQVLAASSMPVRDQETFLPPGRARVRFVSNRGANGIDGLVSTAAGLAAGEGARTWAVLGDLALAHDLGGLAVAARSPGLRLLVLDNGGGGIFHFLPQADSVSEEEFEALLGTPSGLDLRAAAELFGLSVAVAGDPDQLRRALAGDDRVVIVSLDRHRNVQVHRHLAEAGAAALASA